MQSAYRGLRARRVDNTRAIKLALRRTASPIVFTSLTTAAGLFSLQMASMDAIRQLGLFGGLGVLVELLLTLTFLPAFLTFNRRSLFGARRHERGLFVRLDDLVARLAAVRGKTPARTQRITLAITAALTLAALAYIPRIDVTHDLLGHIPDGDDPHPAFEALDARMGGAANIILLMHARGEHGMADRELLLGLEQLEAHLARYRDPRTGERVTGASLSVLDPIRETWLALHDRDRAFDAIPETQRGVHNALTMFENAARDDLRRLVTLDRRTGVMVVRTRWMDARSYTQLVEHVQRGIATHIGDRARVAITGSVFNQFWISQQVVRDMLDSLGLAFVLVLVLIVLLLRDVRVGLVAMVPNVMPVIWVLGYMGASRTPLDPPSVLVFSVVLGIVVDDTIHFFHHFMSHFRRRKHLGAALTHTFDRVSRAMILTTLLLCCEFTIMILADMGSIRTFAVLTTIALFGALWADLVIGPALLRLMFRQTHAKPATSPQARPALS